MTAPNTVFLRLEGPLQAWGDTSKFVIRRTMEAPTKSGVLGLICCAMGLSRGKAVEDPVAAAGLRGLAQRLITPRGSDKEDPRRSILDLLNTLTMTVRIDRPGTRWWDWHTVGAGTGMLTASGRVKTGAQGTLITRREYLADASFLVVLHGDADLVHCAAAAVASPVWPVYLGRKCCPPAAPVFAGVGHFDDLDAALRSQPWRPRYGKDIPRDENRRPRATIVRNCLIEWRSRDGAHAPADAEVWYDAPVSFDPPVHEARLLRRVPVTAEISEPLQHHIQPPPRPRADYQNGKYKKRRDERLEADRHLCVFCKAPCDRPHQATVQHVTYRSAGGGESLDDLRSLCRLCHDAVTMIEYGLGMGLDRIDPCQLRWRDRIIAKRDEIIRFRSLETRRRRLSLEEVE